MYQGLHLDVLEAMVSGLTEQLNRGDITMAEYGQQTYPILTEIGIKLNEKLADHERRIQAIVTDLRQEVEELHGEMLESCESQEMALDCYDAFLESKGLAEEFEEFEHQWLLHREGAETHDNRPNIS